MRDKAYELMLYILEHNDIKEFPVCCDSNMGGEIREISNAIIARYDAGIQHFKQTGLCVIEDVREIDRNDK